MGSPTDEIPVCIFFNPVPIVLRAATTVGVLNTRLHTAARRRLAEGDDGDWSILMGGAEMHPRGRIWSVDPQDGRIHNLQTLESPSNTAIYLLNPVGSDKPNMLRPVLQPAPTRSLTPRALSPAGERLVPAVPFISVCTSRIKG